MRSQTFALTKKNLWVHALGRETQLNVIIDGYQLIRDPIYGGLTIRIKSGSSRPTSTPIRKTVP